MRRADRASRKAGVLRLSLRRLNDPSLIGWSMFWISGLIFLATRLTGLMSQTAGGTAAPPFAAPPFAAAVLTVVATQLATFLFLLAARASYLSTRLARRHPALMVWTLILGAFIGAVVGQACGRWAAPLLGPSTAPDPLTDSGYRALVIGVIGVALSAMREHRAQVTELSESQRSLLQTRLQAQDALERESAQVVASVQFEVRSVVAALPGTAGPEAVAGLRSLAEQIVRPVSHDLATSAPDFTPALSLIGEPAPWRTVLSDVAATPLIAPKLTAAVLTIAASQWTLRTGANAAPPNAAAAKMGGLTLSIDLGGLLEAVLGLGIVFGATWLIASLVRRILVRPLMRTSPARRWGVTIASLGLIAVTAQGLAALAFHLAGFPRYPLTDGWTQVIVLLPLVLITAILTAIRAVAIRQASLRADLARVNDELLWEVARTNEHLWLERKRLAGVLHGPLQAAINAGAIQLDAAVQDQQDTTALLPRVGERIMEALDQLSDGQQRLLGLPECVDDLRSMWRDLCNISCEINPAAGQRILDDSACESAVCEIVAEACSNAIIHGHASRVSIRLDAPDPRLIELSVHDNGQLDESTARGLGTRMIEEVSLGWSLTSDPAGTTLSARLPVR